MTDERLVRSLGAAFDDLAAARTPDYLEAAIERASSRPQRPAWTFPGRWLHMDFVTTRVPTARLPWRQLGVLALIAVLLAAALAVYIGSRPRLPEPFGVAANGLVAYVASNGAIMAGDQRTGETMVIAAGPGHESPVFSPDGTRLAFMQKDSGDAYDLVVTDPLGAAPLTINEESLTSEDYLAWSPDGASVVANVPPGRILFFDASRRAPPRVLDAPNGTAGLTVSGGMTPLTHILFRPPAGDEILFVDGSGGSLGLHAMRPDGEGQRTIIDANSAGPTIASIEDPQWSPDGTRIVVSVSEVGPGDHRKLWILNADGTELRPLTRGSNARDEGFPQWSPDGTKVAFMRWVDWPDGSSGVNVRPITVVDVASGDEVEVGDVSMNGFNGWTWSPDGKGILQIPSAGGYVIVLPIDPGVAPTAFRDWTSPGAVTWQRVAPPD